MSLIVYFLLGNIINKESPAPAEVSGKDELKNQKAERIEPSAKGSSNDSSPTSDSVTKDKGSNIPDKAVVILKKKTPALSDKELNPEFFQKLETRGSGELPVEVVVPRRYLSSSNSHNEEESEPTNTDSKGRSNRIGNVQSDDSHGTFSSKYRSIDRAGGFYPKQRDHDDLGREKLPEEKANGKDSRMRPHDVDDKTDIRESSSNRAGFSKTDGQSEGSFNNKGNWLVIQRQLLQLERQQAHLMNMLQVLSLTLTCFTLVVNVYTLALRGSHIYSLS